MAAPAPASAAEEASFAARQQQLDSAFAKAAAAGGSYIVRYDLGDQSFVKGYGFLDCAKTTPMTADAIIDSGSITKDFTRAAIFKLVEQGKLRLDDPLGELFSGVPADKQDITVSQLLEMSSGLPDLVKDGKVVKVEAVTLETFDYAPLGKSEFLDMAFRVPLAFRPGTKSQYSNLGYQLLAAIIEKSSGTDYESYVRAGVLLPAGMASTGYLKPDFRGRVFADQCRNGESWRDPVTKGLWRNGVSWMLMGAGGMMTTADDLYRFTQALDSGVLFRPDIQARFRRSTIRFSPTCGTEAKAFAGSNGLTTATYIALPRRKETLIAVSTRSEHGALDLSPMTILCPKPL